MATHETKTEKRWISASQAAARVPYTYKHLLKMIKAGKLPPGVAHRPVSGGRVIIDADAFERWIENGCFTVSPGETPGGGAAAS